MKKIFAILCVAIMCIPFVYGIASKAISEKEDAEKFVIIDINMDNYTDYIDIVSTDTAVGIDGNPIEKSCAVITSKLFDDGLYFISVEKSQWDIQFTNSNYSIGVIGSAPFGQVLEEASSPANVKITNIQGRYKFVKAEYVDEYIFENGVRKLTLKDGRYQEFIFEGLKAVDFSYPY